LWTRTVSELIFLAAGYAPAIGFIHTGKPQSFVYDIANLFKMADVPRMRGDEPGISPYT
jgi:CRISPR/Cas system-associated endonuclease Cas1